MTDIPVLSACLTVGPGPAYPPGRPPIPPLHSGVHARPTPSPQRCRSGHVLCLLRETRKQLAAITQGVGAGETREPTPAATLGNILSLPRAPGPNSTTLALPVPDRLLAAGWYMAGSQGPFAFTVIPEGNCRGWVEVCSHERHPCPVTLFPGARLSGPCWSLLAAGQSWPTISVRG